MSFFASLPIHLDANSRVIDGIVVSSLHDLLARSAASEAFKAAVLAFCAGKSSERITCSSYTPPIKALRVIMKLLETLKDEPIERVAIEGRTGCATFTGTITVQPGGKRYSFLWDCAWRAAMNKVKNRWGTIDQGEAARTFGYQCFKYFESA